MNTQKLASSCLRAIGSLLCALGVVHLLATPYIAGLLSGSPPVVYRRAVGPTLLNHVLVGILLLPLGYTTWLAAASHERGEGWVTRVLVVNAMVVLTLPLMLGIFMRRPEYYTAPLFVTAVTLVAIVSILMVAATFLLVRARGSNTNI